MKRFVIRKAQQFVFIPSIGITWGHWYWKWAVAFAWLNIQCRIAFGKEEDFD